MSNDKYSVAIRRSNFEFDEVKFSCKIDALNVDVKGQDFIRLPTSIYRKVGYVKQTRLEKLVSSTLPIGLELQYSDKVCFQLFRKMALKLSSIRGIGSVTIPFRETY